MRGYQIAVLNGFGHVDFENYILNDLSGTLFWSHHQFEATVRAVLQVYYMLDINGNADKA